MVVEERMYMHFVCLQVHVHVVVLIGTCWDGLFQ